MSYTLGWKNSSRPFGKPGELDGHRRLTIAVLQEDDQSVEVARMVEWIGAACGGSCSQIADNWRIVMKASMVMAGLTMAWLLGFGLGAQAQQDAPKEHSMTGCLQKGTDPGMYLLTDLERGPKEVVIAEATVNLEPHLTHKMEITGTAITGKDPQAHTMKVTAVKMLGRTCP